MALRAFRPVVAADQQFAFGLAIFALIFVQGHVSPRIATETIGLLYSILSGSPILSRSVAMSKLLTKPRSREQVRQIDRRAMEEFGVPSMLLMENAGRMCVLALLSHGCRRTATIVCGKGNNGGDGFVIARHLDGLG